MDTIELLQQIFTVCIIPLLGVLTTYLVALVRNKIAEIQEKTDNDMYDKYLGMLADTVADCVTATTQTYVDALKKENAFTKEAQEEAFKRTYEAVMAILSDDAKEYLNEAIGDLNALITAQIESTVNSTKILRVY